MLSTTVVIWLLPLIFLIHDFEEIITAGSFMRKNKEKVSTMLPKRLRGWFEKMFSMNSKQFAVAVAFIFLFVIIGTYLGSRGNMLAFSAILTILFVHSFTHIGQAIILRDYAPGVVTAIILVIPYSLFAYYRLFQAGLISWNVVIKSLPICLLIFPIVIAAHAVGRRIIK